MKYSKLFHETNGKKSTLNSCILLCCRNHKIFPVISVFIRPRTWSVITGIMEGGPGATLSRRNSVRSSGGGSRRGSVNLDGDNDQTGIFGQMKPLKKSKPVSSVKITFMGKPMVILQHNAIYYSAKTYFNLFIVFSDNFHKILQQLVFLPRHFN